MPAANALKVLDVCQVLPLFIVYSSVPVPVAAMLMLPVFWLQPAGVTLTFVKTGKGVMLRIMVSL